MLFRSVSDVSSSISENSTIAGEAHLAGAAFAAAYFYYGWNLEAFDWSHWLRPRSKLRVHRPRDDFQALQEQADLILEKISREGEASLTRRERKKLEQLSREIRYRKQQGW